MSRPLVEELAAAAGSGALLRAARRTAVPSVSRQRRARHRLGRYSFLTADPVRVVRSKGARTERLDPRDRITQRRHRRRARCRPSAARAARRRAGAGLPPFQGGAAGYLAYDWGRVLERLPAPRYDDLALPDVVLGVYDWVLAWDHEASRAWLISTGLPETATAGAIAARATARAPRCASGCASTSAGVSTATRPRACREPRPRHRRAAAPSYPVEGGWWDPRLELRSSFTHAGYLDAVARVREYIFAGDIFQANLSQRFEAPLGEPPWTLYRRLRARNAAPFAAFLDFPDAAVLSASPERFLRVDVSGHVETRPIKGTRPRGVGPEHDARARAGADRERQGSRREPDDRRPDAQRSVARLRAGHRAGVRAVRARALRHRPPPRLDRRRRARARARRARPAARGVSRRLDHRRAQGARDGDHRRARAVASAACTAGRSATGA